MTRVPTSDELARMIEGTDSPGFESKDRRQVRIISGTLASSNSSGVTTHDDDNGSPGAKRHRVLLSFDGSEREGDTTIKLKLGDTEVVGRIGEPTDLSVGWVEPGNTILLEALTERSTADNTYLDNKIFFTTRPGRYRITTELKSSAGGVTAFARVIFRVPQVFDSTITGHTIIASPEVSVVGATYEARTIDMNVTAPSGIALAVQTRASVNGQSAFLKTTRVRYQNAQAAPAQMSFVILD